MFSCVLLVCSVTAAVTGEYRSGVPPSCTCKLFVCGRVRGSPPVAVVHLESTIKPDQVFDNFIVVRLWVCV